MFYRTTFDTILKSLAGLQAQLTSMEKTMTTQAQADADLAAAVTSLLGAVSTIGTDITNLVTALQTANSSNDSAAVESAAQQIQAAVSSLNTAAAAAQAAVPPPPPPPAA